MMEPWQKGHSIYAGVQGEGGQAAGGIAFLVFVGDERDLRGGEGSGDSAGITAALAQPVGRDGRGGDEAVGRGRDGGAEEAAGRERGIASGERDFDDGVGFFRGRARPDTALMAVYGYGKMHAQLVAQGWDPAEAGRDQVMNIMRELGIRGVRRGKTLVATEPAKGTGGRPDPVDGRFEACAPDRLHVADITYVRMANGSFGYTAFVADVYARRIVGWACAMAVNTQELPLRALEQAVSWAASHGGADGLIHHSGHGAQCIGTVYATGVMEYGVLPSTGTVGDSCDNAMAESADGAYRTELVWRRRPFADLKDLELATFRWVSWRGLEAAPPVPGPQDTAGGGNRVPSTSSGTSRLTVRAEQKSGHFIALSQLLGDIGMMGNFNVGARAVDKGAADVFWR